MPIQTIRAAALAIAAGLALTGCEQPDPNGPSPTVQQLYAPYLAGGNTADALTNAPLSPGLRAEVDKAILYGNLLNEPVLDFDPIIFAQDGAITNVRIEQVGGTKDERAVARARFDNTGRPVVVTYELSRKDDVWQIDNIRGADGDLRGIIAAALRPAGEPEAMMAPVKAIYERYGARPSPADPVEPLVGWATFSPNFQKLMEARDAAIRATDIDPLGFDPVIDGTAWEISGLTYEAASSAVIVRFKNGQTNKTIVYDVSDQNGVWTIDDIRAPGVWDVRFKLEEAGIK